MSVETRGQPDAGWPAATIVHIYKNGHLEAFTLEFGVEIGVDGPPHALQHEQVHAQAQQLLSQLGTQTPSLAVKPTRQSKQDMQSGPSNTITPRRFKEDMQRQCCGSGSGRNRNYLQDPEQELLISDLDPTSSNFNY